MTTDGNRSIIGNNKHFSAAGSSIPDLDISADNKTFRIKGYATDSISTITGTNRKVEDENVGAIRQANSREIRTCD
jgi:hypothetical protein